MNKENILRLADIIESQPLHEVDCERVGFTMSRVAHPCGTPGCIVGFAISLKYGQSPDDELKINWPPGDIQSYAEAVEFLGLPPPCHGADISEVAEMLFVPSREISDSGWNCVAGPTQDGFITNKHAAACLRNFAVSGEIDWDYAHITMQREGEK